MRLTSSCVDVLLDLLVRERHGEPRPVQGFVQARNGLRSCGGGGGDMLVDGVATLGLGRRRVRSFHGGKAEVASSAAAATWSASASAASLLPASTAQRWLSAAFSSTTASFPGERLAVALSARLT